MLQQQPNIDFFAVNCESWMVYCDFQIQLRLYWVPDPYYFEFEYI